MKKKSIYIGMVFFALAIFATYKYLVQDQYEEYQTVTSPDEQYQLVVYIKPQFFTLGFSSSSSHSPAYVELKSKNSEKVLAKPGFLFGCEFIIGDLEIEWQLDDHKVYFTKFNYIDLQTMNMSCM